ncbi:hypothetical protein [Mesorhizobium sp. L103C120A0]
MPKAAMFNARIEGIDAAPAFRDAPTSPSAA